MLHFLRLGNGGVVLVWGLVFAKKEHFLKYIGGGYFIRRNNVSSAPNESGSIRREKAILNRLQNWRCKCIRFCKPKRRQQTKGGHTHNKCLGRISWRLAAASDYVIGINSRKSSVPLNHWLENLPRWSSDPNVEYPWVLFRMGWRRAHSSRSLQDTRSIFHSCGKGPSFFDRFDA